MDRRRIPVAPATIPTFFHSLLDGAAVYDSSSSRAAQVYYIEKDCGYYLKTAPKGTLLNEAELTRYFHKQHLSAEVLAYETLEQDWMLTARIPGEDCIHPSYLNDPVRLCDTTAELLRALHDTDCAGCPIPDRTATYLATAAHNHAAGACSLRLFSDTWQFQSTEEAWQIAEAGGRYLKSDTLLHGDYCLPNIILDNWKFSGFIDLDTGGVGDRHVDLFWGIFSLHFNLKTNKYRDRFLDAYGRADVNEELFRVIAAIELFG